MPIHFFSEDIRFNVARPHKLRIWINKAAKAEKKSIHSLNYIFCSDKYLLTLNVDYLKHSTLTDIITFNFNETRSHLVGEIYISIERVKENASKFKTTFEHELLRVMIHGVLHLSGYNDKTKQDKMVMRKKEEAYVSLYK